MKFLDLNTGYSFDGLWTDGQTKGYTFWFPNEQSTDIIYTMPICILTTSDESLDIRIENNEVFYLINNISIESNTDGYYVYDGNLPFTNSFTTSSEKISDKYFAHIFNVACRSSINGEFTCKINIDKYGWIRVGADFYNENETLAINLSNFGVEIPDTIQKAIYDSNVNEDFKDNILINRKFKELLSNYWDIIANKGSYKSLKNSLDWFEWDDNLNIKEIWKRTDSGLTRFDDRELCSIFEDKIADSFNNFARTTYVSLYYNLYEKTGDYDNEGNPEIKEIALRWAKNDMQLKLALLAQFFGTFFLPIHLSIFHASLENIIYTNSLKTITGANSNRTDCVGDFTYIESNVKDDSTYKLENVKVSASENTLFAITDKVINDAYYKDNLCKLKENTSFGVDDYKLFDHTTIKDHKTFNDQYYCGPGVIIPIRLRFDTEVSGEFIKQTNISYTGLVDDNGNDVILRFYDRIYSNNKKYDISFNFLAKKAIDYVINITFITSTSKTLTKTIRLKVEDPVNVNLNIYKIRSKDDSKSFTYNDFKDTRVYNYMLRRKKNSDEIANPYYMQYLPYMSNDNFDFKDYKGIKLSRTIVLKVLDYGVINRSKLNIVRGLFNKDFLEFAKYNNEQLTYLIYVSKKFYAKTPMYVSDKRYEDTVKMIRNDLGFYPQFHTLERIEGNTIDSYTISPYEAMCVAAELSYENGLTKEFNYSNELLESEWTFYNSSTHKETAISKEYSSRTPFIASYENDVLEPGYYDIKFKYTLKDGDIRECILKSAFRIKPN